MAEAIRWKASMELSNGWVELTWLNPTGQSWHHTNSTGHLIPLDWMQEEVHSTTSIYDVFLGWQGGNLTQLMKLSNDRVTSYMIPQGATNKIYMAALWNNLVSPTSGKRRKKGEGELVSIKVNVWTFVWILIWKKEKLAKKKMCMI